MKQPEVYAKHCDVFNPLKDGKGKCKVCGTALPVKSGKRTHKKRAADPVHDLFTTRIGLGILFTFVIPFMGVNILLRTGWDNLAATIITMSLVLGAALLLAKNGKKA